MWSPKVLTYSSCGCTRDLYSTRNICVSMNVNEPPHHTKYTLSLVNDRWIWAVNVRLPSINTPRSFSWVGVRTGAPLPLQSCRKYWALVLLDHRCRNRHFPMLKGSCQVADQLQRPFKSFWRTYLSSWVQELWYHLVSSANNFTLLWTISGRSFTYRRKRTGPSTLPCGTPLVTGIQADSLVSSITRWSLSVRKSWIHARTLPWIPYDFSLVRRRPWDTVSKALLKSR